MADKTWRVEYDNECTPDGDGESYFHEWWSVTDGKRTFRAEYQDDAELLAAALNGVNDAERYRYLRDRKPKEVFGGTGPDAGCWIDAEDAGGVLVLLTDKEADEAIDAAMARKVNADS